MRRILSVANLTFWEGIRMRIVIAFLVLITIVLLMLGTSVKGDGTLAGRLQAFLWYALQSLSFFLSLAAVFFACSTLANDVHSRTIHLVVTKPVSRFEILAGKWLGVNLLGLLIVAISGLVIYGFAASIKQEDVGFERDRLVVDDVVWTARAAARPEPPNFAELATEQYQQRVDAGEDFPLGEHAARIEIINTLRERWRLIEPFGNRLYTFNGIRAPLNESGVYQVRFKARTNPIAPDEVVYIDWAFIHPQNDVILPGAALSTHERAAVRHQFLVRSAVATDGVARLVVANPPMNGRRLLYFEGEDGIELLYRVGTFEGNLVRALLLVAFRIAFLTAVGLLFATFVSFPVACFCTLSILLFCIGVPWWLEAIGAKMEIYDVSLDPYGSFGPIVRLFLAPVLKIGLPNFVEFDGVDRLIDGNAIRWGLMLRAALHTVVYGAFLIAVPGLLIFRRREIAEVIV